MSRARGASQMPPADASTDGREPAHIPVLAAAVLEALSPGVGGVYVDGTFGAGGYSRAILDSADCRVIALDRDPAAVAGAAPLLARYADRLTLVETPFGDMEAVVRTALARDDGENALVDGVVLDIGVSSMQLDTAERGFSFMADGPLDMRMGAAGPTVADLLATSTEATLADVIFHLGEERQARRIARAIAADRIKAPIDTTQKLARLVARIVGRAKGDDRHPATRTFQALRIWVNDELGELARALTAAERILKPGGRLAVVTFHSLEDRIVKRFLARRSRPESHGSRFLPPADAPHSPPSFELVNRRPVSPGDAEIAANPRARSAKLRAALRTGAPAVEPESPAELGLPIV